MANDDDWVDNVLILHLWMLLLTVGVIELQRRTRHGNRRWWVRPINRNRSETGDYFHLFQEMKKNDPEEFFKYTRMMPPQFEALLRMLTPLLIKHSLRKSIGPEQRLAMTLKYLSQGDSMVSLSWQYRVGRSTVSCIIKETCDAIWTVLSPMYVTEPNKDQWLNIAGHFLEQWNFPHCIGAIDGKHVAIQCPLNGGSKFYNYKGSHSVILMAVCDADYRFTLVDIGGYGSQGDRCIFANSSFGQKIISGEMDVPDVKFLPGSNIEMPFFFVGDEAFPLKKNLLRPYPGKNLTEVKKIYNYRLSRARRTIENAFGILASRWRIFRRSIIAEPDTVDAIIKAAVSLHNFLKTEDLNGKNKKVYCPDIYVDNYDGNGNVVLGQWRQDVNEACALRDVGRIGANRADSSAYKLRDDLADYLMTEQGEVGWQYEYVNRGRYRPQM